MYFNALFFYIINKLHGENTLSKLENSKFPQTKDSGLYFEVKSSEANILVIGLNEYATEVSISRQNEWQEVMLKP